MKIEKINYDSISALSFKDLAYIRQESFLDDFIAYDASIESFSDAIRDRKLKPVSRTLLVDVLNDNYSTIQPTAIQSKNIQSLLSENTFTITTAHQPSLFGGPLYYILKICSVINLCKQLKENYPDSDFVPTFISGGEDHDFEEVDHLSLFGSKTLLAL